MATAYTHSIPTPPFSPQNYRMPDENAENPLKSTINLLDSLVAFYQHERMWVYRTRATLEDAFQSPPPPTDDRAQDNLDDISASTNDEEAARYTDAQLPSTSRAQSQQSTRWNRRKRGFKLRIDGIRHKRVISTQPVGDQHSGQLPPREHILQMFEKMMESRMESCQRVNKMIQDANRANLHQR
ncbi:hypothetical protein JR316_0004477 [Psilocybe cubensis]|uniref:Uncharacterized protein n=2 Tax=Psilocybe cubensis TaxID=181762 RepID=A0A8H8CJN4_PSICU|nr:hypothetical protein JR316_0004477 [Psilocybe cubensis]KAH9482377.1 hypothetical protein JR316_0004477 [Psilocybe cubensis]